MALLAAKIVKEAIDSAESADELATRMEPHLHKLYTNSSLYGYQNAHSVPPGDVLMAIALATGISLDEKLGIGREPNEMERQVAELRAQMAELRGEVSALAKGDGDAHATPAEDVTDAVAMAEHEARQRRRASRAPGATPPPGSPAGRSQRARRPRTA